jgi:hypothetical protein
VHPHLLVARLRIPPRTLTVDNGERSCVGGDIPWVRRTWKSSEIPPNLSQTFINFSLLAARPRLAAPLSLTFRFSVTSIITSVSLSGGNLSGSLIDTSPSVFSFQQSTASLLAELLAK